MVPTRNFGSVLVTGRPAKISSRVRKVVPGATTIGALKQSGIVGDHADTKRSPTSFSRTTTVKPRQFAISTGHVARLVNAKAIRPS